MAADRTDLYELLRRILGLVLRVFFRQLEVVGREHIPVHASSPVIFAGNHPNSLIDPALIIATAGRKVHFAAKDVLFRSALLRPILTGLGAVPIARRKDHEGEAVDNRETFGALIRALARGGAMGIFPEGISHDDAHLSRMRTGAARIALTAASDHPELGLQIIPVGLTYVRRRRFRSRVLVQYGAPIEVSSNPAGADDRDAVRSLTEEIDARLRALTINAPDWETVRVLDGVRRLYQPPRITLEQRIELARRFTSVYAQVSDHPDIHRLYRRVRDYLDRLRAAGLSDRDVSGDGSSMALALRVVSHAFLVFLWLPLALPGAILYWPLAFVIGWCGVLFSPRKDVIATTKLGAGCLFVGGLHLSLAGLVGWLWGWPWALAVVAGLLVSGWATLETLDRFDSITRLSGRALRTLFVGESFAALRRERRALVGEIEDAIATHLPADMPRLFAAPSAR